MAALTVAMLRPAGGPDPQYAAHQRIYDSAADSKSKRVWSPRLKLNSSASTISKLQDKSPDGPYMYRTISSPGGSALSKSMKYAETWLYGTVSHSPTQIRPSIFSSYPEVNSPVLISTPQKNPSPNYAVIICSCPEYLNGTKKSSSTKVSICKKCKGSRLPITIAEGPRILVGGTLRGPQTSRDSNALRAGTMKIHNSKSRPSILSSKSKEGQDPYDLMRRTRLATPHEARISNNFATLRTRARSISPSRNRSRRVSPASTETSRKTRSKSVTRTQEAWTEEVSSHNTSNSRRSILICDLNPYELINTKKKIKTKKYKDDTDDELNDICDENFSHVSNHSYPNTHAIAGQRVKISDKVKSVVEELSVYDQIHITNDLVETKHQYTTKELPTSAPLLESKMESTKKTNQALINGSLRKTLSVTNQPRNKVKASLPKRPPRKSKPATSEEDNESGNEKLQQLSPSMKISEKFTPSIPRSNNQVTANGETIKSILKKPRQNTSITCDGEKSGNETPSPSQIRKTSGSQFYLPSPNNAKNSQSAVLHRKKVQFLVENNEVNILCSSERLDGPKTVFFGNTEIENNSRLTNGNLLIDQIKDSVNTTSEFLINEIQLSSGCIESNIEKKDKPVEEIVISKSVSTPNNTENDMSETGNLYEINYDVETKDSTSVPRVVILRRSESERLPMISTVAPPKFLDSMALRPKTSKLHTSQVFLSSPNIFGAANVKISLTENKIDDDAGLKDYSSHDISNEPNSPENPMVIDLTESPLFNSRKSNSPEPPPRMKTKEIKPRKEHSKFNYVKTRFIRNNSNSSTNEWCDTSSDIEQKTILKVSQSDCNTGDAYKVTIENDVDDSYESYDIEPRRTSILINGDDCYSTMNVSHDTPIYLSSVVVNDDYSTTTYQSGTTVTICVNSPEILVNRSSSQVYIENLTTDDIAISELKDRKSLELLPPKRKEYKCDADKDSIDILLSPNESSDHGVSSQEISELLKNPVEAVRRNLVPHVCGKALQDVIMESKEKNYPKSKEEEIKNLSKIHFIAKLLEDPLLGHLAEGLESDLVVKLIENSLLRLKQTRNNQTFNGDRDEQTMNRLIEVSLSKLKSNIESAGENEDDSKHDIDIQIVNKKNDTSEQCEREFSEGNVENNCSAPYESMEYESGSMGTALDMEPMSDCYNVSASEISTEDDTNSTRSKFYQMLVDATLCEIEISNTIDDDHHYESIRLNNDPIYEEINDMPPPLPSNPPPSILSGFDDDKKNNSRSIFEGASKYDILSYLVDAKERGIIPEDTYICNFENISEKSAVQNLEKSIIHERQTSDLADLSSRESQLSNSSDSSEDNSLVIQNDSVDKAAVCKKSSAEIERNDSGVGSETSKSSRSRWQSHTSSNDTLIDNNSPIHLCEDCDSAVETQVTESGVMYAPLVCRKCAKKRAERKEIITEIVETEEKYGRDLQIILEEFYKPMLVAGLLTQEQLSAIFLNVEELLENNQALAEKLRDALEIAVEQGDEDLLTVNIGKVMLESAGMLHAFSAYCVRQGGAALLLTSLEKDKELLRIFLRVSQMENAVLRRMNLNSFLMVPVQRVTKYPLLLTRLYKVTPAQAEGRELLKQAQHKIELHLSHMNAEAKDVSAMRLWRRISSGGSGRRSSSEIDIINIKLRKMAVDVLEWNHDEARFAMEGKLLYTQPNDNNWRRGKTIKLTPINALLVTNGKPTSSYKPATMLSPSTPPAFPHSTGVREATLLLVKDKGGRYALLRDPLYLDRCVVAADADWDDYFEIHEITSKDTFIFKAEDSGRTQQWYAQLQYHAQGSGAWRKRRNALANIMINGMLARN